MPLFLFLFSLFSAHAQTVDCSTPRVAADSLFQWTATNQFDPTKASTCMDVPPGANGARLAVQFKQVLDARGLWVPVPSIPNKPDYLNAKGEARVVPMQEDFRALALVKLDDGRWVYSRHTVDAVPGLYASTFSPMSQWFQSQLPATRS